MSRFLHYWDKNLPYFFQTFWVGLAIAVLLTFPAARWLRLPRFLVFGLLASATLVVAATLTPDVSEWVNPWCIKRIDSLWPVLHASTRDQRFMNTVLFVPLGFFAGLAAVRSRLWILAAVAALPLVIEIVQRVWLDLYRNCQIQDLFDNLWGLLIGAAVGALLGLAGGWRGQQSDVEESGGSAVPRA